MFKISCINCKQETELPDDQMKQMVDDDEITCPKCGSYDVYISEYPEGLSNSSKYDEVLKYLGFD